MAKTTSKSDPRGLIGDAYRIEGIHPQECRSIFLDWALEPRSAEEMRHAAQQLLKTYGAFSTHPMTEILRDSLTEISDMPMRRGGRRARMVN